MKTYHAKPHEVERKWYIIDAEDQVLGRVATKAATLLKGKHKPQIRVTGTKELNKVYYHHTGHPGGLKSETFAEAMAKHPERVIEHAVKGMLPKNTLGRKQGLKLKVYAGAEHPHMAQKPTEIKMEG